MDALIHFMAMRELIKDLKPHVLTIDVGGDRALDQVINVTSAVLHTFYVVQVEVPELVIIKSETLFDQAMLD